MKDYTFQLVSFAKIYTEVIKSLEMIMKSQKNLKIICFSDVNQISVQFHNLLLDLHVD